MLLLIATLVMACLPALLFLGLLHGLRWMQTGTLVTAAEQRSGQQATEVSVTDAFNSVFSNGSVSLTPSRPPEQPRKYASGECHTCGTQNSTVAEYCKSCTTKL